MVVLVAIVTLVAGTVPAWAQDDDADDADAVACDETETGSDDEAPPDTDADADADDGADAEACDPGPQQVSLADLVSPQPAAIDAELQAALSSIGFLDTWYSVTPTHPSLSLIVVSGTEADEARTAFLDLVNELITNRETTTVLLHASQDAIVQRRTLERATAAIDTTISDLAERRIDAEAVRDRLAAELDTVVVGIQRAAIGVYVSDTQVGVGSIDDVDQYNDQRELAVQVDATLDDLLAQRAALEMDIADRDREIDAITDTIETERGRQRELGRQAQAIDDTIRTLTEQIAALTERRIEIETGLPQTIGELHRVRLLADAPVLNITLVTLDAYVQAAETVGDYYPDCGVRWELLAGIARVESAHATFGGNTVLPNGDSTSQILGPLLDGSLEGTAIIEDTDGGLLDGNDEFDAAVGPFQFIPGTWAGHGLDRTGDGFADPHNVYDAGLSAAGYLCASSNLNDDEQIARSVLSYNRSQQYLADVTEGARNYIIGLALPEAAFDPETIDPRDGWGVHFEEVDPYALLGQVGVPESPELTGRDDVLAEDD